MEGKIFINEAINDAISKYLKSKDTPESEEFQSFLVIVIRILVFIYGELDIMNPFRTSNESGAGGFNDNIKKFGLPDAELAQFKQLCLDFYQNSDNKDVLKNAFIEIQKILIDMFLWKKSHIFIDDKEVLEFKNFLYSKEDSNEIKLKLYQELSPNSNEVINYFNSKLFEQKHNFVLTKYKDIVLDQEAYQLAGYNIIEVMNKSEQEIMNINNKVYHFFRIKETDMNKKKRLASAVLYYKKYGNAITSGNGYVDVLLISSIVATVLMITIIVAIHTMG